LMVDRFIGTAMSYPANYGFIPNTLAEDGDCTDAIVVTPYPVLAGAGIRCRALGILLMEDEAGVDSKIIAVPTTKICGMYANLEEVADLPQLLVQQLVHFFENYKKLEAGKWVKLAGIKDKQTAIANIVQALAAYRELNCSR
jgi:inorganic pyrophosphatase